MHVLPRVGLWEASKMNENLLSIVSAVTLVGVAAWAFLNDRRVSRRLAAHAAANDETVDLAGLGTECRRMQRMIALLGPERSNAAVGAANLSGLSAAVARFGRMAERHSGARGEPFARAGQLFCSELALALEALSCADTIERRRAAGQRLAGLLGAFLPLIEDAAANDSTQAQLA